MLLLDELVKIGKLEDKIEYSIQLYQSSMMFRKYLDIAYDSDFVPRYTMNNAFPKYGKSMVPHGYNYSKLERQFGGMVAAGFIHIGSDDTIGDGRANSRLMQIFESLSELEVVFLKSVLLKSVDILPLEIWRKLDAIV